MKPKVSAPGTRSDPRGRRPPLWPDLNFSEIAEAIGVSSTFVGRIMNGRVRPGIETAQKLANYLKWPLERVAALYDDGKLFRSKKFPYRKKHMQEGKHNGKGIERTGGRTKGTAKRKHPRDAASRSDKTHKGKRARKARPAAAR